MADIARRAPADPRAQDAFCAPLRTLGTVLADWAPRFGAEQIVVGGAMSRSWALVEPALRAGLARGCGRSARGPLRGPGPQCGGRRGLARPPGLTAKRRRPTTA